MIHQIGRKLRQQMHYFSGELCNGMGSIASRFIEEAVFGISSSGSVRLPECPKRPLWLVVVKVLGKKPLMLLTTEPMRRNRKVLWWAVETYGHLGFGGVIFRGSLAGNQNKAQHTGHACDEC